MSVQLALGVVGGAIGSYFGYPQLGFALGSLAGAAVSREKIQGPKLDDLSAPRLQYGQAIPRIYGTVRVSGTPIFVSELVPHESSEGGKGGGPEVTSTTYSVDALFLLSIDTPIVGVSRIWVNKKLEYSVGPETTSESRIASENTNAWQDLDVMDGNAAQLPWAEYEAAVGVGNAPAIRHRSTIGIATLNCGPSGQIPLVEFEVFTAGTQTSRGYSDNFDDGTAPYTGDVLGFFNSGSAEYGGAIQVLAQPVAGAPPSPSGAEIERSIPTTVTYGFRVKFHMTAQSNDDAGIIAISGASPDMFLVIPRREITFDALQRCHVFVAGIDNVMSAGPLDMFTWYQVEVDLIPGVGNSVVRLINLSTDAVSTVNVPIINATSYVVDEVSFRSEFGLATGDTLYSELRLPGAGALLGPVDLQDILEAEGARVGLDGGKLDASATAGIEVTGYATTGSARNTFEELARIYYFGGFCDDKLRIVLRGGSSTETLTFDETGAGVDQPIDPFTGMDRADELAVPAFFSLVYSDPTRDYDAGSVMSDRLVTQSSETAQTTTSVVLSPSQAKGRVDSYARDARASSHTWNASVGISHLRRTPTDLLTLTDSDGTTYRSRIDRATLADFTLRFEGSLDDANALADEGIGPPDGEPSIEVTAPGVTVLDLIDGPILRDTDDDAGLYGAVRINGTGSGSRIFKSIDGATFTAVGDVLTQATTGSASTALGDVSNPYVWDEVNTVTVGVVGTLTSSTKAAMQADATINLFALKSGDGWEYLRARTASLLSPGVYMLSGLIRGLRGTEAFIDGHAAGDRFIVLSTTGMLRIPGNVSEVGLERFYRGVTLGSSSSASIALTNEAVGLKPFSPAHLHAERDASGNITLTWSRRTRLAVRYGGSGGTLAPLGEDSEEYQIDIYDGAVVRTLTSSSESVAYSAADQTTDFGAPVTTGNLDAEVFQISAAVGRGYGHRASV